MWDDDISETEKQEQLKEIKQRKKEEQEEKKSHELMEAFNDGYCLAQERINRPYPFRGDWG